MSIQTLSDDLEGLFPCWRKAGGPARGSGSGNFIKTNLGNLSLVRSVVSDFSVPHLQTVLFYIIAPNID
jgi:hypothetical protein